MPIYISRGRFTSDAVKGMLAKPENREEAVALFPKVATAQYTVRQCTWLNDRISEAMKERSFKELVSLQRQKLSYCQQYPPKLHDRHAGHAATDLAEE
jgi:tRNA A37 N6-isopentenylltransferase MiaA